MNILLHKNVFLLRVLAGCWLVFLLAACESATMTGPGTSTSTVTSAPILTAPAAKLVLTFACQGDFTPSSRHEKVCVQTLPGASLTMKVTYCMGSVDQSPALKGTFTADKTGSFEWSWTPKATCQENPPGATGVGNPSEAPDFWKGTAEVMATLSGQHLTSTLSFRVSSQLTGA